MKKGTKIIIGIVSAIIFFAAVAVGLYFWGLTPLNGDETKRQFVVEKGDTLTSVSEKLGSEGFIKSGISLRVYAKLNNFEEIQAGNYELSPSYSIQEIVKAFKEGPIVLTKDITFKEGKHMRAYAKLIAENTDITEEEVFEKLKDEKYIDSLIKEYWFITANIKDSDIYYPLEGYLYPDTYNYMLEDLTVEKIFKPMLDQMEKKLEPYKEKIQTSNIDVHKLLTVASICEAEANSAEDRPGVASVIYNRIKNGMSIGSDVTTYYAIKVDMSDRDLYQSELDLDNPYNTRGPNMEGKLPVGPICSVSISAIDAAINPDESDYLFFVSDKNGKLYFTKTSAEHEEIISELKSKGLWFSY